jgi:anti-anti-sigma factor
MLKLYTQKLGDVSIICVSGRIVVGETAGLRRVVQSQSDVSMVVLDFARVTRIDAGGLGVLLELRESLQSKGVAFRLMNITQMVLGILALTCLDGVFEVSSESTVLTSAVPPGSQFVRSPCAQHA